MVDLHENIHRPVGCVGAASAAVLFSCFMLAIKSIAAEAAPTTLKAYATRLRDHHCQP
jgi:hypothetical protein